jgi:hypothetical protein
VRVARDAREHCEIRRIRVAIGTCRPLAVVRS